MAVTLKEVEKYQQEWVEAILRIQKAFNNEEDIQDMAMQFVCDFYAIDQDQFLFNPVFAVEQPFRNDKVSAIAYFIGGNTNYAEDDGFAIKQWDRITFKNKDFILRDDLTLVSGDCILYNIDGRIFKTEYTIGFQSDNGKVKIVYEDSHITSQSRVLECSQLD